MRAPLAFLLLLSLAAAQFTGMPIEPTTGLTDQISLALQLAVILMMTMLTLAAAVYVGGQFFGAETRAKASVWAQSMLAAVGVSAAVLLMLYFLVPGFETAQVPAWDINQIVQDLIAMAQTTLAVLTVVMLVLAAVAYAAGHFFGAETRARATGWANGLIAGAVVAAAVYMVVFQLLSAFGMAMLRSAQLNPYLVTVVQITFFISLFIIITYLLSRVFKVPEWEAYLNIELSNLMGSFLIVLFVLGLFGISTIVVMGLTGIPDPSPPRVAAMYMQGTVADSTLKAMTDVYKINACTSILSTISRRIGEYVLTQTYKIFPGIDTFAQITNMLGFTLITVYSTISVQIDFLYVIDALMIPFCLPAGLILRFIPPTRDSGAFLIALAFGLQIVFPTTYIINKQVFEEVGAEPYKSPTLLIQSLCGPFKFGVAGFLFNPAANPIFSIMPGGQVIGTFLSRLVSESLLNLVSMAEFIPILRHVAVASLLGLFMPALSMMVTIAFINAMTKFIVSKV